MNIIIVQKGYQSTPLELVEENLGGDPGILIDFAHATNVHNCLGLNSVATVAGVWGNPAFHLTSPVQGKNENILDHFSFVHLCIARDNCKCVSSKF